MPWITIGELADQVGYPVRTLHAIAAREPGVLVTCAARGKRGSAKTLYSQPECAINLRRREVERLKRENPEPASSEAEARTRKLLAEAAQEELKLAKLRGQLVTVDDYARELARTLSPIRQRLLALPGRAAVQVATETARIAEVQQVLDRVVREILQDMVEEADRRDETDVTLAS